MPHYDFGRFPKLEHQKEWIKKSLNSDKVNQQEIKILRGYLGKILFKQSLSEDEVFNLELIYARVTE